MKLKLLVLIITATFLVNGTAVAQKAENSDAAGLAFLGLGIGQSYGGIGGRFSFNVVDRLNTFVSLGHYIAGTGYDFGLLYSIAGKKRANFYTTAMYGTNSATFVAGPVEEYNKVYNGLSVGFGLKVSSKKGSGNYFDIAILIPFKPAEFRQTLDAMKNDSRLEGVTTPPAMSINIGYNFRM